MRRKSAGVHIEIEPSRKAVRSSQTLTSTACPAAAVLAAMRDHPLGRDAARIGEVIPDPQRFVQMRTALGGRRMVDWLAGEQLPRIC